MIENLIMFGIYIAVASEAKGEARLIRNLDKKNRFFKKFKRGGFGYGFCKKSQPTPSPHPVPTQAYAL